MAGMVSLLPAVKRFLLSVVESAIGDLSPARRVILLPDRELPFYLCRMLYRNETAGCADVAFSCIPEVTELSVRRTQRTSIFQLLSVVRVL